MREHQDLVMCSYSDDERCVQDHVISFAYSPSVIRDLGIQLVDVSTIMTQNFTAKILSRTQQP